MRLSYPRVVQDSEKLKNHLSETNRSLSRPRIWALRVWLAMSASVTDRGQRVTTIAGFGKCVGRKTYANFVADDLVDDFRICPCVKIIDKLCSLVAKKLSVGKS